MINLKIQYHKNPLIWLMFLILLLLMAGSCKAEIINLDIIAKIESGNNSRAYNRFTQATGTYQITPICLKDYNAMNKTRLSLQDMFKPLQCRTVAEWYLNIRIPQLLRHYKKQVTINNVLISYNAGISYVINGKPLPKETINYIAKYEKYAK